MVFACRRCARSPSLEGVAAPVGVEEELGADLAATDELDVQLGDAVDVDLAEEPGSEVDAELDQDLEEDLEVDGDESSACAPYLARQMSCLGSRTPGVKDTPFLGSARGVKEAGRRLLLGEPRRDLRSSY